MMKQIKINETLLVYRFTWHIISNNMSVISLQYFIENITALNNIQMLPVKSIKYCGHISEMLH
jgi:hypothetical protein